MPLSSLVKSFIVKFPSVMLCLFVHIRGFPFKNHVYAVFGIPYAMQGKVTVVFDPAVVSCGFRIHSGLAIGKIITLFVTQEDPHSKRRAFQSFWLHNNSNSNSNNNNNSGIP